MDELMVDPDRRPTAQEIEELIDLVRRDPGSPAFIDLGEAYLSLGRPRDAIQVGNLGLESSPDSLEGRVMLARAYHSLHQWKEAQGELLRVVKVDRSNRIGFALLGEVLLRRSDFERAVPVLQHAQNLDPTSPQILTMLKRARAGQPLDPPVPVPQPIPPRGETDNRAEIMGSRGGRPSANVKPRLPPPQSMNAPMVPVAGPAMPTMAIEPPRPAYDAPNMFADAAPNWGAAPAPAPRGSKQTAPPPLSVEGVRPRIVSGAKPQNAAAASLRQSAAVGETYLNDLLTGGLLDVAGVRVPDVDFDLRPDRRWGRSTRRAFIFLFVVLVLGIGGGGTWYWWSERQKSDAVARLQRESKTTLAQGSFDGLEESLKKLLEARDKDDDNEITIAYFVEVTGLEALLYGTDAGRVYEAHKKVADKIKAGDSGARELLLGKAAAELATLHKEPNTAIGRLVEVNKELDGYLAKQASDKWAVWLKGRALLAGGERKAARAAFKSAGEGEDGLAVAVSDAADLLVDDGQLEEGLALYKKANELSKDHPIVVVSRALARAEAAFELDDAISELNDKFVAGKIPPRIASYRYLALSLANINILPEDFPKAIDSLAKATKSTANPPGDARFWARAGWAYYILGNTDEADKARRKSIAYSAKFEVDPSTVLVEAGLALAFGLPEKALEFASKLEGVRPRIIRAYALLDLGKPKEALAEADQIIKVSPQNVEAQILREQARMISSDKDRTTAADELQRLAKKSNSKLGSHALGVAYLAVGNKAAAKTELEKAIVVTDTAPNPIIYRTHTALAEIALSGAEPDIKTAALHLDASQKVNSRYFPTLGMQARVNVRIGDSERAMTYLEPILKETGGAVTTSVNLTLAEALITKKSSTDADKARAKEIIVQLKDKAPAAELSRIAALIDPKLPDELGLQSDGGAEAPPPRRRRGRRP